MSANGMTDADYMAAAKELRWQDEELLELQDRAEEQEAVLRWQETELKLRDSELRLLRAKIDELLLRRKQAELRHQRLDQARDEYRTQRQSLLERATVLGLGRRNAGTASLRLVGGSSASSDLRARLARHEAVRHDR